MNRKVATIVTSLALAVPTAALLTASPAEAAGKYYSSCDKLHKDFKHGVAKSRTAARKQVRDGYQLPAYSAKAKAVYKRNHSRLDRDDDGTACEA